MVPTCSHTEFSSMQTQQSTNTYNVCDCSVYAMKSERIECSIYEFATASIDEIQIQIHNLHLKCNFFPFFKKMKERENNNNERKNLYMIKSTNVKDNIVYMPAACCIFVLYEIKVNSLNSMCFICVFCCFHTFISVIFGESFYRQKW